MGRVFLGFGGGFGVVRNLRCPAEGQGVGGYRRVGLRAEPGDQVVPVGGFGQARKGHAGAGHDILGFAQVDVQTLGAPAFAGLGGHRLGIGKARMRGHGAVQDPPEIGAGAVRAVLSGGVAGRTFLEDLLACGKVDPGRRGCRGFGRGDRSRGGFPCFFCALVLRVLPGRLRQFRLWSIAGRDPVDQVRGRVERKKDRSGEADTGKKSEKVF